MNFVARVLKQVTVVLGPEKEIPHPGSDIMFVSHHAQDGIFGIDHIDAVDRERVRDIAGDGCCLPQLFY